MIYSNNLSDLALVCEKAHRFLGEHDMAALECGRHELGDGDFVNVMEYDTRVREGAQYEAHRDYVDIQVVVSGIESVEVAPLSAVRETQAYDDADDYALCDGAVAGEEYFMEPGRFAALFPEDAHMPRSRNDEPARVKKAVFKIRLAHMPVA